MVKQVNRYPYSVRRQHDGGMGTVRYVVVRNPGGKRVSQLPPSLHQKAWKDCDRLNVLEIASTIRSRFDGLTWQQCWQVAREHYLMYLPFRTACFDERVAAINAYTDEDMPEDRQP